MKKIYYLLVCLFFLQSAFAAGEKQSFDVCLQNGLNMNVEVCTDGIFRIRVTPRSTFSESLMQRTELLRRIGTRFRFPRKTINSSLKYRPALID